MKKKIFITLIALICATTCAFGLAACGGRNEPVDPTHMHNYVWVDNGDGTHKQHCSVNGCDMPDINNGNHDFTNGNCVCGNVKPNESHTHSWALNWSSNETQHWLECSGCSEDKDRANHIPGAAATTTTPQTCTVCGYVIAEPIGHTHSTTLVPANSANCTESGNIDYYTCDCSKWFSDAAATNEIKNKNSVVVNALGHAWQTEWTVDVEATTEYAGSKSHHCSRCSEKTDVTEIPRLTVTKYNVIFNANGGKIDGKDTKTITGTVNQKINRPNDPTRTDYTFTGWYKDGATNTLWNFDTDVITGATTLYAGWRMNITEYDVTFVLNYPYGHQTVKSTESGLITYIPVRAGYIFNGWWYSDGQTHDGSYILTEKYDTSKRVTQSGLTLYAEWVQERTSESQLYSPSVSISEEGVFSWDAVADAQGYKVEVYSGTSKVTEQALTTTSWTFPNSMTAGYYIVKIRASGNGETTVNSAWTEKYYSYHMLGVAYIQFNNATSILTWDAVKNAATYEVRVDNALKDTITYTAYDLSYLEAGDYVVSITPVRDGWASSTAVNQSISKKRLKTPSVTVTENDDCTYTVSWLAVAHADTYRIKHHDTYITVTGTSYTVNNNDQIYDSDGTGEFTVVAYDSNADYFISNDSENFEVEKMYALTLNQSDSAAGTVSSTKQIYRDGDEVAISASTNMGYTWLGWYDGDREITKELLYSFIMSEGDKEYTAKYKMDHSLEMFTFTSTPATLTITGVKDKSVTELNIPASVTSIAGGAFFGCSNLESLTLPFVGGSIKTSSQTYQYPFGYIFGTSSYTGGVSTQQQYYGGNTSSTASSTYYIPSSLKNVTITGGDILYGAFYNCTKLTGINILDGVTNIKNNAFYGCSGLKSITVANNNPHYASQDGILYNKAETQFIHIPKAISGAVTIPDSVTSIAEGAFSGCSNLESLTLPFVGGSIKTSGQTYQYPFGYIFGKINYTGGVATIQHFYYGDTSSTASFTYYIPSSLKNVTITGGDILYGAFYNCTRLTSITIPNGVTSIGSRAFSGCTGLTSVTIPNSVTSIGSGAFYNCTGLTSITIPNSVTSIGSDAFYNCPIKTATIPTMAATYIKNSKLKTVVVTGGTSIGNDAFKGCTGLTSVTIPNGVTSIGNNAFYNCTGLTSITIPNGVTSIGNNAFYNCTGLTSITIPNGVTSIGNNAFGGCTGLTSITIPNSVTSIGSSAFGGCPIETATIPTMAATYIKNSGLKTVVITGGECIARLAFNGCTELTSVTISDSVTSIGEGAFSGTAWYNVQQDGVVYAGKVAYKYKGTMPSNTSIVLKDDTKGIADCAFYNCTGLTSVTIPNGVTDIGYQAFSCCTGLTSITIPNSVTSIGGYAFSGCTGFTSITIPNSVTSIGSSAFGGCTGLTSVKLKNGQSRKTPKAADQCNERVSPCGLTLFC